MFKISFLLCVLSSIALGDERLTIPLWSTYIPEPSVPVDPPEKLETAADGLTRRFNVSDPRLFVHLPEPDARTGSAMIIVPGGGFARLADEHEGRDVATWLTSHGITAFQLAYRTPTKDHAIPVLGPAQDVQRAVAEVRRRAAEWNVDPAKVGVIGFSAGGQAALVAAGSKPLFSPGLDLWNVHPDALLLIYPYQVMDPETKLLRSDINADIGLPPTFISQAADDKSSDPAGSLLLFSELHRRGIAAELHIYETGGHGFGMRPRPNAPGSRDWSPRAIDWLTLRGFVKPL